MEQVWPFLLGSYNTFLPKYITLFYWMKEESCNTSVNYLKQLSNLTEILFSTTGNLIQNTHLRLLKKTNRSDFNQQLKTTASNYISDRNVVYLGSTVPVPQVSINIIMLMLTCGTGTVKKSLSTINKTR